MGSASPARVDIRDILARTAIEIHFQPIVSGRQRAVIGVEALCRGQTSAGALVSPAVLFQAAAAQGLARDLDHLCRRRAVAHFAPLLRTHPRLVLFVNTLASTLADDVAHPATLMDLVQQYGVDPRNVAVELSEAERIDTALLRAAVEGYNRHSFLVVLDDVGVGYSNLDRILLVKPDMLKADRTLVQDLHRDVYKQGVFKALVVLSERIGGWLIAEGVETRDDAVVALDLGADMLQGFLFGRPQPVVGGEDFQASVAQVRATAAAFQQYAVAHFTRRYQQEQQRRVLVQQAAAHLAHTDPGTFDDALRTWIRGQPAVASACVVDAAGRQMSDTILNSQPVYGQKTVIFAPPARGTDHALKEYVYLLAAGTTDVYQTQPYVPLPSGQLCITVSTAFPDAHHHQCIVCLHIAVGEQPTVVPG